MAEILRQQYEATFSKPDENGGEEQEEQEEEEEEEEKEKEDGEEGVGEDVGTHGEAQRFQGQVGPILELLKCNFFPLQIVCIDSYVTYK